MTEKIPCTYDDIKNLITLAATDTDQIIPSLSECIKLVGERENFLADEEDASNLLLLMTKESSNNDIYTLQLIADIAKLELNRPFFTNKLLMSEIIPCVISDNPETCLQSIRSLANICADNADACQLFLECGGVEKVIQKAEDIAVSDDKSWSRIIQNACLCIRNLIINSEILQEKFLANNALSILWRYVNKFYSTDPDIASAAISGISALVDSENGFQRLEESKILEDMLCLMKKCNDDIIKVMFSEILTEYGGRENARVLLCKCGYVGALCSFIEDRANFQEIICSDDVMKEMADVVVMLSSGEESFAILQQKEEKFLNRLSDWIASPNIHIQVSAGLALGNYARSEETCSEIVAKRIHENLINVIKENMDDETYYDRFQSYASCLRNLTIPVENKSILIAAGLHLLAVELIKKPSLGVQFKGLAIIRLLLQGNGHIAIALMSDDELILNICELSGVSCVTSVPSEAQRLMAALFKYSNSEVSIRNGILLGGLKPVLTLLSSDHMLMQNEGLVGLIISIATVHDCLPSLNENEVVQKVIKLIKQENVQTQTVFNCLTFLQAVSSLDGGIDVLKSHGTVDVLENIRNHNEEIIRNKVVETLDLIN